MMTVRMFRPLKWSIRSVKKSVSKGGSQRALTSIRIKSRTCFFSLLGLSGTGCLCEHVSAIWFWRAKTSGRLSQTFFTLVIIFGKFSVLLGTQCISVRHLPSQSSSTVAYRSGWPRTTRYWHRPSYRPARCDGDGGRCPARHRLYSVCD